MSERVRMRPDEMNRDTVESSRHMDRVRQEGSYLEGLRAESTLQRQLAEAMEPFDALVCPTTAIPGLPAADDLNAGVIVDGVDFGNADGLVTTLPFNVNNRCPVLNVPSERSSWGLPTGVQIVAHTYDDPTVFRIGKAVEHLRPWTYDGCLPSAQSNER